MTSITFGGGPDIETRRKFSNLKEGSQVPGYKGYIHQLKYNCGHTYGDSTHELKNKLERNKTSLGFDDSNGGALRAKPLLLRNSLPKSNGINRLTETMVPGYTGYVPQRKFKFSATYKNECDECVDDFLDSKREKFNKEATILRVASSQPKLVPIAGGDDLNEKLAVKNGQMFSYLPNDKRKVTEAPMPGYTGHVPKIVPTELGLGARYHVTTERGLRAFDRDYRRYKSASNFRSLSFEPDTSAGQTDYLRISGGNRLYVPPGMIPQYTGHIHGRRYEFGNTYGNTTRELPVCAHNLPNFGEYMKTLRGTKTFIC